MSFQAFFIRPFYKMMLQKPITLQDMESVVSAPILHYTDTSELRAIYLVNYACCVF